MDLLCFQWKDSLGGENNLLIKIILIVCLLAAVWIIIDNFRVKRKITRLIGKVEQLTKIAKVKYDLPKEELSDEAKINYLQNQLDSLEPLLLLIYL